MKDLSNDGFRLLLEELTTAKLVAGGTVYVNSFKKKYPAIFGICQAAVIGELPKIDGDLTIKQMSDILVVNEGIIAIVLSALEKANEKAEKK